MSKNAITVIDQELIDSVGFALANKVKPTIGEIKSLLEMSKDLIEINEELTKREQYVKSLINQSWNGFNAVDLIDELNKILKDE